jgi:CheY-like chemotaxis protein
MKSSMQGKGLAAPDPKPSPSVNMANLTRLSVLVGEADVDRSREIAALLVELGVRQVMQVQSPSSLLEALKRQAFDVLLCAERLGPEDGVAVLRAARDVAPATRSVLMRANDRAGEFVPDGIEAIELPFSRLKLQGLLHRAAAPHGGLWCEVPELSLTDILQMYHQARRSITVLLSGPIAGRIWLEAGEIVDAEAHGERGMSALSRLLEAESGLVRTEPPKGPVSRSISAPFRA